MPQPSKPQIISFGSLNIDLVVRTPRFPRPGETLRGQDLETIPGGKGANQAAAAALQELPTAMVGLVGDDPYGRLLGENLENLGVDTSLISSNPEAATGSAVILVNDQGENCIVLSPGANGRVSAEDADQAEPILSGARILLLQLEIPYPAVKRAASLGKKHGLQVILNPAPGREIDQELLAQIDLLVPNQTELSTISGIPIEDQSSLERAARKVLESGLPGLIVTLGAEGALVARKNSITRISAPRVKVVDTTAAGDAFIGGLAAGIFQGKDLREAVRYANCAGALTVTRFGAQPSLPHREEVESLYRKTR